MRKLDWLDKLIIVFFLGILILACIGKGSETKPPPAPPSNPIDQRDYDPAFR